MAINSRKKGSKNERDVCKWWERWTGFDFDRVPASGGLRWGRTTDTAGDIICSDKKHFLRFPFSIECKAHKDINFEHILLGNKNIKIREFWEQAQSDAQRAGKLPILMMRYNGMKKGEYFFLVSGELAEHIKKESEKVWYMDIHTLELRACIFMASQVIEVIDYPTINKLGRNLLKKRKV